MVEYLAITLTIITAMLAITGLIQTTANGLMGNVNHQLRRTDRLTVDHVLQ